MTHRDQINALKSEIESVIERFRLEFEIPYASAIGVLEVIKMELLDEAKETEDDD